MRGLTQQELDKIISFVQENHSFALYIPENQQTERTIKYPKLPKNRGFSIKYVDVCYDTRDKSFWNIKFRPFGVCLATNHYIPALDNIPKDFKFTNLYDWCMAYLTGEWQATDEFLKDK